MTGTQRGERAAGAGTAEPGEPGAGGSTGAPARRGLAALAALAAVHAAWAAFEWAELVAARRGGEALCGPGGGACAALWDGAFASALEGWTGLPVAGWGLLWSGVALALPLWARRRAARGETPEPAWSAALWTAGAGAAAVLGLAGVSAASGALCPTCLVTYGLVLAYALLALGLARRARPGRPVRGGLAAALSAALAFLLLLAPGLATPPAPGPAHAAVLEVAREDASGARRARHDVAAGDADEAAEERSRAPGASAAGDVAASEEGDVGAAQEGGAGEPGLAELRARLEALPADARQRIADDRAKWLLAEPAELEPPRALVGSRFAPVRITEWSDYLCPHCAELHEGLAELRELAGPRRLAVESRQFPLDGACNPHVRRSRRPLRCRVARVMICAEGEPGAFALSTRLFEAQRRLSRSRVRELSERAIPGPALERCLAAEATAERLRSDIRSAVASGIRGTPHVLVNGRPAPGRLDFLFAITYAEGDPTHAFFEGLPEPEAPGATPAEIEARAERVAAGAGRGGRR